MTTWLHFCGGNYTPDKFVKEAQTEGITRRLPWMQAKRMQFGDKVLQAYWGEGHPRVFCEWTINGVCTDAFVAEIAANELGAQRMDVDPAHIDRECGEFEMSGGFTVSQPMDEVVEKVHEVCSELGTPTWVMVSGYITSIYEEPYYFDPEKRKFARGFLEMHSDGGEKTEGVLLQIGGYKKA